MSKYNDSISRQAALYAIYEICNEPVAWLICAAREIEKLPPAQPPNCEGCKHLGKWENEVEYGYPSPCTRCKRRVGDHYER